MKTVLIHGASSAAGWYDMEAGGWANRLNHDALLSNIRNPQEAVVVQNSSIPGNTIVGVLKDLERISMYRRFGGVTTILAIGLNEAKILQGSTKPLVSLKRFRDALERYSDYARGQDVDTIYVGTEPLTHSTIVTENGNTFEDDLVEEYNAQIAEHASVQAMPFVSQAGVFGVERKEKCISPDGYHPSSLGHFALYTAIREELKNLGSFMVRDALSVTDISSHL